MVSQIVSTTSNQSSSTISVTGTPAAGDLIVLMWAHRTSGTPVTPSAVSGCGATWANAATLSSGRVSVWIGTGATASGTVTVTHAAGSGVSQAVWLVRGVANTVNSTYGAYDTSSTTLTATLVAAGSGQVVVGLGAGLSATMPTSASTPAPASWNTSGSSQTWAAGRAPASVGNHQLVFGSTAGAGNPRIFAQIALGTPAPVAPVPVVASKTAATASITWAAVPNATAYTMRIDNGSQFGPVTSPHALSGLSPATSYLVEVKADGPGGESGWGQVTLTTDAPPAPPDPTVEVTGPTTATVTWPPVTDAVSYDMRLDGGAQFAATSPELLTGLTAATTYLLEMKSNGIDSESSWSDVEFTTDDPPPPGARPYYRVLVSIGDEPEHSWLVESTDDPAMGPTLPLSFGWSVPSSSLGFPAQPDPLVASFGVIAASGDGWDDIDLGTPVHIAVWLSLADGTPWAEFSGRIGELDATPHPLGQLFSILAVDYTVDLAALTVGDVAWPEEPGNDRAERILTEAGIVGAVNAYGDFQARASSPTTALAALLETLTHGVGGAGDEPARTLLGQSVTDGVLDVNPYVFREVERSVAATDTIDGCLVSMGSSWRRTRLSAATFVTINHPGGPTTYGSGIVGRAPVSSPLLDPVHLATFLLDNTGGSKWVVSPLRLHLWAADSPHLVAADWFEAGDFDIVHPGIGREVVVDPIAAPSSPDGATTFAGMLCAARFTIPPGGRFVVDFDLRQDMPTP